MSLAAKFQGGLVLEGAYGTVGTPTRFLEVVQSTIVPQFARIKSQGLRSGVRTQRSKTITPYKLGGQGDITLEVATKGDGIWLKPMLGASATTGPNADGKYTHTGTFADLLTTSFTWQDNRPFHPSDTNQPFTFFGGKVYKWELGNSVDGLLTLKLSCDFMDYDNSTALAAASYPSGFELFSFVGATVTIGGVQFDFTDVMFSFDNSLKLDRRYGRANPLKKEPVEQAWRVGSWAVAGDYDSLTQLARVASLTAAGAVAQIVATWQGPTLIAGTSYPSVTVTVAAPLFNEGFPTIQGSSPLSQSLKGDILFDDTNSPVAIAYGTVDTTP